MNSTGYIKRCNPFLLYLFTIIGINKDYLNLFLAEFTA